VTTEEAGANAGIVAEQSEWELQVVTDRVFAAVDVGRSKGMRAWAWLCKLGHGAAVIAATCHNRQQGEARVLLG
jgi:hypothetical protein